MSAELRIGSLNLRAYPNPAREQISRMAKVIVDQQCDVVLLQECLRPWLDVVCEVAGMTGVHAHDLPPECGPRSFSPDGCAIAVRPEIRIARARRIRPESFTPEAVHAEIPEDLPRGFRPMPPRLATRYSSRSVLADLDIQGESIVAGSFHATPGTGRIAGAKVGEWKPFFHGGVALELARLDGPFVFAIDANEPLSETYESITFHWDDERPGVKKLQALLGLNAERKHRARDLWREWLQTRGDDPASGDVLLATYSPSATFQRRFDSMWATKEFSVVNLDTLSDEVRRAGGDHAMLVATLRLRGAQA